LPLDESQLEGHYQQAQGSNSRIMFTALDRETKDQIGHIELTRIDRENRKASIAYVLVDPKKKEVVGMEKG
jgi:RimJ/RimL family protein N-acetyltransferase